MFKILGRRTAGYRAASCRGRNPVSAALAAIPFLVLGCNPDAGRIVAASSVDEEPEPVAVTVFTDKVELFMEFPRLLPGLDARYLAHVTVLATGEPVRSGKLRLELTPQEQTPTTEPVVLEAPRPKRDGLFIPVGAPAVPGVYQARIVVESDQVTETIPLEPIVVHKDLASAFEAAQADAGEEPADAVPFLLESQWKIGMRMELVERRTLTRRLQVLGEIEAPQHALAVVSSPLAGRLVPPEGGRLPRIGERAEPGQVVGFIEPPLTISDAAQLAANEAGREALEMELMVREFDLRAKALEIEQALLQSETHLVFVGQALARIEGLRAKDLGTVAELEAARRDVALAERASAGAQALRASFEEAKEQLGALAARRAEAGVQAGGGAASGALRVPLTAPIGGEIVAAEHVAGEHVESHEALYDILDLSRVWISIHVPEFDLGEVEDAPGALLRLTAYPDRTFDVLGEMKGSVVNIGRVVDPETRTVRLRYEASNPEGLFRAGMLADVFLETKRVADAVALAEESIVMDNGRPVAFVLLDGETFQRRYLELGIRDGRFVEVLSGIEEADRVVTQGAYLVKLASAAPAAFGDGHAH